MARTRWRTAMSPARQGGRSHHGLTSCLATSVAVLTLSLGTHGQSPKSAAKSLTIERLPSSPSLLGTPPSSLAWSPDARTLAFLWNDRALSSRDLWTVPAQGGTPT